MVLKVIIDDCAFKSHKSMDIIYKRIIFPPKSGCIVICRAPAVLVGCQAWAPELELGCVRSKVDNVLSCMREVFTWDSTQEQKEDAISFSTCKILADKLEILLILLWWAEERRDHVDLLDSPIRREGVRGRDWCPWTTTILLFLLATSIIVVTGERVIFNPSLLDPSSTTHYAVFLWTHPSSSLWLCFKKVDGSRRQKG